MTSPLDQGFEARAKAFLAAHPDIPHEWREIRSHLLAPRVDLVCAPGAVNEVFATLSGGQITVGATGGSHDDFEDFGRGLSDDAVAAEAFERFVQLLRANGHVPA